MSERRQHGSLVGQRLGPYAIVAPIGAGGMGAVYKAHDTRLDRFVAIKVSKEEYSDRFRREARAIAQLDDPRICTLHDVGPNYLVMEYVEGAPLKGPLPVDTAVTYARQILEALDAAHRKQIVHRDLKPANILVGKRGITLLDFGLARTARSDDDPTLTRPGDVMGTPGYMAPEQWAGQPGDARTDIYAFGCVLYEMLTGEKVTPARAPAEPPALERVIERCLAKDPDDRFQSARDLRTIVGWAGEPAAGGTPATRRTWWIAGVTTAALLAGLGALAMSRGDRPTGDRPVLRLQLAPPEGGWFGGPAGSTPTPALSPDGKSVVYGAMVNGRHSLWIRSLDTQDPMPLRGTEDGAMPFWSPDGRFVAFVADGKLRRIDVAAGTVFDICDVPRVRGGAWGADGRIVLGTFGGPVAIVPAAGGTLSPLTTLNAATGDIAHVWPQLLPDGRFLYWGVGRQAEHSLVIYAASFAKPDDRVRLVASETNALYSPGADGRGYLIWQRGGTLLAQPLDSATLTLSGEPRPLAQGVGAVVSNGYLPAAVSPGALLYAAADVLRLTWFDREGRRLSSLGDPALHMGLRLSPDGSRAAASRGEADGQLWLIDLARGTSRPLTSGSSRSGLYPQWSPDGRTVLFIGAGPAVRASARHGVRGVAGRPAVAGGHARRDAPAALGRRQLAGAG